MPWSFNPKNIAVNKLTKIKFYVFDEKNGHPVGTCYDGQKAFSRGYLTRRFYPDEYLIADILEKYVASLPVDESYKIIVLTEEWIDDKGSMTRDGSQNIRIGVEILALLDKLEKEGQNALILAPFLYEYHHPGMIIHVTTNKEKKRAHYLDPFGSKPYSHIKDLQNLIDGLKSRNYSLITNRQQRDGTSCGPIQTASMLECINWFRANKSLEKITFPEPRVGLASDRMTQMAIRNPKDFSDSATVYEVSLADSSLWKCFFEEQRYGDEEKKNAIYAIVNANKAYVSKLPEDWYTKEKPCARLSFMMYFQAELTKIITDKALVDKNAAIDSLIEENRQVLQNMPDIVQQVAPAPKAPPVEPQLNAPPRQEISASFLLRCGRFLANNKTNIMLALLFIASLVLIGIGAAVTVGSGGVLTGAGIGFFVAGGTLLCASVGGIIWKNKPTKDEPPLAPQV